MARQACAQSDRRASMACATWQERTCAYMGRCCSILARRAISRHMWMMGTAIKENVAAACRRPLPHCSRQDTSCAQADGLSRQCPTIGCRPARTSSKARRPQQQRRATRRRPLLDDHPRGCPIVRNDPSKHPPETEVTGGSMRPPRGCERPGGMAWWHPRQKVKLPP